MISFKPFRGYNYQNMIARPDKLFGQASSPLIKIKKETDESDIIKGNKIEQ
jgi:hypothetical protein